MDRYLCSTLELTGHEEAKEMEKKRRRKIGIPFIRIEDHTRCSRKNIDDCRLLFEDLLLPVGSKTSRAKFPRFVARGGRIIFEYKNGKITN